MRATNLYVFKAGDMYALTVDETGSNLPKSSSGEWLRFGDTTTIDRVVLRSPKSDHPRTFAR